MGQMYRKTHGNRRWKPEYYDIGRQQKGNDCSRLYYMGNAWADQRLAGRDECDHYRRQAQVGIRNASFHIESITGFCDRHEGAFDRAFALDFTEHVYDEDLIPIAASIRRSLRKGGRLYIHTPNRTFFLELLKDKGVCRQLPGHIAVRSADQYVSLLRGVGFNEVKVSYLSHYLRALSWLHGFSSIPVVGKYLKARLFLECLA